MAPAAKVLLAALAVVSSCVALVSADNIAIPFPYYALLPANSHQDPAIVTALPPGMSGLDPAAMGYFIRWLQCSSLVQWCTPEEVYAKCTYEPKGSWYRASMFINAPLDWPYCMPRLDEVYASCSFLAKQTDSCNIWDLAPKLGITLPRQRGNTLAEIAALPSWAAANGRSG